MARYAIEGDQAVKLQISEHAIIRYLQRVRGLDIDQVLKEMIPEDILETVQLCNGIHRRNSRGYHFSCSSHAVVINDQVVITVLSPDMVEVPSEEWKDWSKDLVLRAIPVEGTPYEMAIECEVRRRVNDEAWEGRQQSEAMKAAKLHTETIRGHYQKKIERLEKELERAEAHARTNEQDMIEAGRWEKAKAVKICEHVENLLGPEKYAQLENEVEVEVADLEDYYPRRHQNV